MEIGDIKSLVSELDEAISKENAQVQLSQYGGGPDESAFVANRLGYLRFGIEFMKAGLSATEVEVKEGPTDIEVDLSYLITSDSDIYFDSFEIVDKLSSETPEENWKDTVFVYTVIAVLIALPILAIVGLISIIRALI